MSLWKAAVFLPSEGLIFLKPTAASRWILAGLDGRCQCVPEQTPSLSPFQSPHLMGACYASAAPAFWQTIIRICLVTHGADQRMLQEVITIRRRAYVFFLLWRKSCLTTDCLHTRCLSSAHLLHRRRRTFILLKKLGTKIHLVNLPSRKFSSSLNGSYGRKIAWLPLKNT